MYTPEEDEEIFFDSLDSARNSIDSSFSEDLVNLIYNNESMPSELQYNLWINEPESIYERRTKFLREMSFEEIDSSMSSSCRLSENDRSASFSSPTHFNEPNDVLQERIYPTVIDSLLDRDSSCSTSDSDGGNNLLVPQQRQNDLMNCSKDAKLQKCIPNQDSRIWHDSGTGYEHIKNCDTRNMKKNKTWWKSFSVKKNSQKIHNYGSENKIKTKRMQVKPRGKKLMDLTALYMVQEIQAHKGRILCMKFSPDGMYLGSGGEDGVIRIWPVIEANNLEKYLSAECSYKHHGKIGTKHISGQKQKDRIDTLIRIPKKTFELEETPLQELYGHTSDVLDISWSKCNFLISSSKDKTVRLWQVSSNKCLRVFHHNDYVTCIQFNPVDDGYFISGSVDGKARIWSISENRVVDWVDVREIITAICYQPDGQGCIAGCITGICRHYDASGNQLQLERELYVGGKKNSSGKRISGIQFSPEDNRGVMITSADSKIQIYEGADCILKYKGHRTSGSMMSSSFTSDARHIISAGQDSQVYIWNYSNLDISSTKKQAKSVHSCEHFFSESVSIAIPWCKRYHEKTTSLQSIGDSRELDRTSFGSWRFGDCPPKGSATWPEEKLPSHNEQISSFPSSTWGMVMLTSSLDGVIRTFHNYGFPVRI